MVRIIETTVVDTGLRSPGEVLDDLGLLRGSVDRAEAMIVQRAADWADLHPADDPADAAWPVRPPFRTPFPGDEIAAADEADALASEQSYDLPSVRWSAIPEFAARLGMSTGAGQQMILDALELRHRLPRTWAALQSGRVQAWRARRIAQRTAGQPTDVATWIDEQVAPVAQRIGLTTLDRLIDEAMLRLHPEERELQREQAREQRHVDVRTGEANAADGLAYIDITADTLDAVDFEAAVAAVAARLAEQGDTDSLDVRRSKAIGILADPEAAAALLAARSEPTPGERRTPKPRKEVVLHVHLSDAAITGSEPLGRLDQGRLPVLAETVRAWAGRGDARLTVQPVIDLREEIAVGQYEIPDRIRRQVELRIPTCAHPWCNRPAERCDKDHLMPYDSGGETTTSNLAPLCRRHHRLKTLTAWTYEALSPSTFLWTSPHGRKYLKDNTGTTDVTP